MKPVNFYDLLGRAGRKLEPYSNQRPNPVSLKSLIHFGRTAPASKSFEFLKTELPVRMATMIKEAWFLPESLLRTPPVIKVAKMYAETIDRILKYAALDGSRYTVVSEFTDELQMIIEQNVNVVAEVASGLNAIREAGQYSLEEAAQLQYFLDRFYINRIGIRTLMTQHVLLYGPVLRENESYVGCIDPECSPLQLVVSAYGYARMLCHRIYGRAPGCFIELYDRVPRSRKPVSLNVSVDSVGKPSGAEHLFFKQPSCAEMEIRGPDFKFCYIPGHLFHIMFELFKNAMRAVVEHRERDAELPRLHVVLCNAKEDVTIKLSDLGGGMPVNITKQAFAYTFTTAQHLSPSLGVASSAVQKDKSSGPGNDPELATFCPLAGRGHGLPLSRLYARYFSGDLRLSSVENYGTSALVYFKRLPGQANELLPIFNTTSKAAYEYPYTFRDWTSGTTRSTREPS